MKRQFDVIVVGGGMTGLSIAALLAGGPCADAMRLTLVDASPRPTFTPDTDVQLRVSAIATGTTRILATIGAWDRIKNTRVCPYEHMRVWDAADEADGPSTLRFDADDFAVPQLGYIIENLLIQDAVLGVLDRLDVNLRFNCTIAAVERDDEHIVLELDEGRRLEGDLVIAADGADSFVRRAMGIDVTRTTYEQVAFVTHLRPERDHGGAARQRFLADGPLGMLPLADGRISVVWSTTPGQAAAAKSASDAQLGRLLTEASDWVLGELEVAGPRGTFPLAAQHAHNYVLPRLALIGDAAHAVHPLAGQGANLGLQDAQALRLVLEEAMTKGEHPGDKPVLRRYERARKGANATMMHFMTLLNRLFASDSATIGELRRAGMRLFNVSGPVRDRAVRVALGADRQ